jgi:oligopeptide/dipeptide ABC transporter ATP-binding protein
VEVADKGALFANPLHPYIEGLLASVPVPDPHVRREARLLLPGDIPSPTNRPKGCYFHTPCPYAQDHCRAVEPKLREISPGHWAACHLR